MNCCTHQNGINQVFSAESARAEADDYRKHGLERADRRLAERIAARGVAGASVLEIGGGIGGVQIELLRSGAAHTTDVDISRGYVAAAEELAQSLGFGERAEHRALDFAQDAGKVPPADIVILNRVVCCYPDLPALLAPAAERARRLLALVFPRDAWWVRLGVRAINATLWLARRDFRAFAHPNAEIIRLAEAGGLRPVLDETAGVWRTILFERVESS